MKKTISLLLIVILMFSSTIGSFASTSDANESLEGGALSIEVPWFEIAWKIINYAGNSWFDRDPVYNDFGDYQYTSSGDIDFNNGTNGPRAYHIVDIPDTHRRIDAFAQTSWVNWLDKIAILIDDANGNEKASKSVTHDQHLYYTTSSGDPTGEWKVSYVEEGGTSWDLWLFLWDTNVYSSSTSTNQGLQSVQAYNLNTSEESITDVYVVDNNIYVKPSPTHKNINQVGHNKSKVYPLNIQDLMEQIFDNTLNKNVYSFKNFNIGDTIIFSDSIKKVFYDSSKNATFFILHNADKNQDVKWGFAGNLTPKYTKGDKLDLKFKVVEKYSDENITLETLDYIQDGIEKISNSMYPDINDYIVK